jgi:putative tricarboxylic transport membrane protein
MGVKTRIMGRLSRLDRTTLPFLLISVLVIFETGRMHVGTFSNPGPGLFPLLLGILLAVSSLISMITSRRGKLEQSSEPSRVINVLSAVGILLVFRVALPLIGYPATTFLVFLLLLKVVGSLDWLRTILYSAAFTGGSYLLFVEGLAIRFPRGVLGF